jgi:hypothetical protein
MVGFLLRAFLSALLAPFRSRIALQAEILALRHQLAVGLFKRSRPASGVSADRNRRFWRNLSYRCLLPECRPVQNRRKTVKNSSRIMRNVGKTVSIRCRTGMVSDRRSATIEPTAAGAVRCCCVSTAGSCSPPRTADLCVSPRLLLMYRVFKSTGFCPYGQKTPPKHKSRLSLNFRDTPSPPI